MITNPSMASGTTDKRVAGTTESLYSPSMTSLTTDKRAAGKDRKPAARNIGSGNVSKLLALLDFGSFSIVQNCTLITAAPCGSIFHAGNASQMPYMGQLEDTNKKVS